MLTHLRSAVAAADATFAAVTVVVVVTAPTGVAHMPAPVVATTTLFLLLLQPLVLVLVSLPLLLVLPPLLELCVCLPSVHVLTHLSCHSFVPTRLCWCSPVCVFIHAGPCYLLVHTCLGSFFCMFVHVCAYPAIHLLGCASSHLFVCSFILICACLGSFVCIKYTVSTHIIIEKLTSVICIINLDKNI